ncbi:tyrosine-protein phosphatase [Nocardia sp. NPDC049220]|uniref:tyrosine-protein phosphatase n=1 Tax=Nocardia sp. NPDC049220 TaxID=3155273 RepID=UPI003407A553
MSIFVHNPGFVAGRTPRKQPEPTPATHLGVDSAGARPPQRPVVVLPAPRVPGPVPSAGAVRGAPVDWATALDRPERAVRDLNSPGAANLQGMRHLGLATGSVWFNRPPGSEDAFAGDGSAPAGITPQHHGALIRHAGSAEFSLFRATLLAALRRRGTAASAQLIRALANAPESALRSALANLSDDQQRVVGRWLRGDRVIDLQLDGAIRHVTRMLAPSEDDGRPAVALLDRAVAVVHQARDEKPWEVVVGLRRLAERSPTQLRCVELVALADPPRTVAAAAAELGIPVHDFVPHANDGLAWLARFLFPGARGKNIVLVDDARIYYPAQLQAVLEELREHDAKQWRSVTLRLRTQPAKPAAALAAELKISLSSFNTQLYYGTRWVVERLAREIGAVEVTAPRNIAGAGQASFDGEPATDRPRNEAVAAYDRLRSDHPAAQYDVQCLPDAGRDAWAAVGVAPPADLVEFEADRMDGVLVRDAAGVLGAGWNTGITDLMVARDRAAAGDAVVAVFVHEPEPGQVAKWAHAVVVRQNTVGDVVVFDPATGVETTFEDYRPPAHVAMLAMVVTRDGADPAFVAGQPLPDVVAVFADVRIGAATPNGTAGDVAEPSAQPPQAPPDPRDGIQVVRWILDSPSVPVRWRRGAAQLPDEVLLASAADRNIDLDSVRRRWEELEVDYQRSGWRSGGGPVLRGDWRPLAVVRRQGFPPQQQKRDGMVVCTTVRAKHAGDNGISVAAEVIVVHRIHVIDAPGGFGVVDANGGVVSVHWPGGIRAERVMGCFEIPAEVWQRVRGDFAALADDLPRYWEANPDYRPHDGGPDISVPEPAHEERPNRPETPGQLAPSLPLPVLTRPEEVARARRHVRELLGDWRFDQVYNAELLVSELGSRIVDGGVAGVLFAEVTGERGARVLRVDAFGGVGESESVTRAGEPVRPEWALELLDALSQRSGRGFAGGYEKVWFELEEAAPREWRTEDVGTLGSAEARAQALLENLLAKLKPLRRECVRRRFLADSPMPVSAIAVDLGIDDNEVDRLMRMAVKSDLLRADVVDCREQFAALGPELAELGRGEWYWRVMVNLRRFARIAPIVRFARHYDVVVPPNDGEMAGGITGRVDRHGVLHVTARVAQGTPSGAVMFGHLMDAVGDDVRVIHARWVNRPGFTSNLDTFNDAIKRRLSPIDAALLTFTGKMAVRAGYPEPEIRTLTGTPGEYVCVEVRFSRPSSETPADPVTLGAETRGDLELDPTFFEVWEVYSDAVRAVVEGAYSDRALVTALVDDIEELARHRMPLREQGADPAGWLTRLAMMVVNDPVGWAGRVRRGLVARLSAADRVVVEPILVDASATVLARAVNGLLPGRREVVDLLHRQPDSVWENGFEVELVRGAVADVTAAIVAVEPIAPWHTGLGDERAPTDYTVEELEVLERVRAGEMVPDSERLVLETVVDRVRQRLCGNTELLRRAESYLLGPADQLLAGESATATVSVPEEWLPAWFRESGSTGVIPGRPAVAVVSALRSAVRSLAADEPAAADYLRLRIAGLSALEAVEVMGLPSWPASGPNRGGGGPGWELHRGVMAKVAPVLVQAAAISDRELRTVPTLLIYRAWPLLPSAVRPLAERIVSGERALPDAAEMAGYWELPGRDGVFPATVARLGEICLAEWAPAVAVPARFGPTTTTALRALAAQLDPYRAKLLRLLLWLFDEWSIAPKSQSDLAIMVLENLVFPPAGGLQSVLRKAKRQDNPLTVGLGPTLIESPRSATQIMSEGRSQSPITPRSVQSDALRPSGHMRGPWADRPTAALPDPRPVRGTEVHLAKEAAAALVAGAPWESLSRREIDALVRARPADVLATDAPWPVWHAASMMLLVRDRDKLRDRLRYNLALEDEQEATTGVFARHRAQMRADVERRRVEIGELLRVMVPAEQARALAVELLDNADRLQARSDPDPVYHRLRTAGVQRVDELSNAVAYYLGAAWIVATADAQSAYRAPRQRSDATDSTGDGATPTSRGAGGTAETGPESHDVDPAEMLDVGRLAQPGRSPEGGIPTAEKLVRAVLRSEAARVRDPDGDRGSGKPTPMVEVVEVGVGGAELLALKVEVVDDSEPRQKVQLHLWRGYQDRVDRVTWLIEQMMPDWGRDVIVRAADRAQLAAEHMMRFDDVTVTVEVIGHHGARRAIVTVDGDYERMELRFDKPKSKDAADGAPVEWSMESDRSLWLSPESRARRTFLETGADGVSLVDIRQRLVASYLQMRYALKWLSLRQAIAHHGVDTSVDSVVLLRSRYPNLMRANPILDRLTRAANVALPQDPGGDARQFMWHGLPSLPGADGAAARYVAQLVRPERVAALIAALKGVAPMHLLGARLRDLQQIFELMTWNQQEQELLEYAPDLARAWQRPAPAQWVWQVPGETRTDLDETRDTAAAGASELPVTSPATEVDPGRPASGVSYTEDYGRMDVVGASHPALADPAKPEPGAARPPSAPALGHGRTEGQRAAEGDAVVPLSESGDESTTDTASGGGGPPLGPGPVGFVDGPGVWSDAPRRPRRVRWRPDELATFHAVTGDGSSPGDAFRARGRGRVPVDAELRAILDVETVAANVAAGFPAHRTLVEVVSAAILDGRLEAGRRMPSAAALGAACGMSAATVGQVYAELRRSRLLMSHQGSGTVVADFTMLADSTVAERDSDLQVHGVVDVADLSPIVAGCADVTALTRAIEAAILEGRLAPNRLLPGVKDVAESIGVSRSTAARAYSRLRRDGLLKSLDGVGTVVAARHEVTHRPIAAVDSEHDETHSIAKDHRGQQPKAQAAIVGSPVSLDQLRERFEAEVAERMAARYPKAAAQLVAEVFRRAQTRIDELDEVEDVRLWVMSLTDGVLSDHGKFVRHTRFRAAVEAWAQGADREALAGASHRGFRDAVAALPRGRRLLLMRRFMYGMSTEAVAEAMGVGAEAVRDVVPDVLRELAVALGAGRREDDDDWLPAGGDALARLLATGGVNLALPTRKLAPAIAVLRAAAGDERLDTLRFLVERLYRPGRENFIRWWLGEAVSDIAEARNVTPSNVKRHLRRVVPQLAVELGMELGEDRADDNANASAGGPALARLLASGGVRLAMSKGALAPAVAVLRAARDERLDELCLLVEKLPPVGRNTFVRWWLGEAVSAIAETDDVTGQAVHLRLHGLVPNLAERLGGAAADTARRAGQAVEGRFGRSGVVPGDGVVTDGTAPLPVPAVTDSGPEQLAPDTIDLARRGPTPNNVEYAEPPDLPEEQALFGRFRASILAEMRSARPDVPDDDPRCRALRDADRGRVWSAVAGLTEQQREYVRGWFWEPTSLRALAQRLGLRRSGPEFLRLQRETVADLVNAIAADSGAEPWIALRELSEGSEAASLTATLGDDSNGVYEEFENIDDPRVIEAVLSARLGCDAVGFGLRGITKRAAREFPQALVDMCWAHSEIEVRGGFAIGAQNQDVHVVAGYVRSEATGPAYTGSVYTQSVGLSGRLARDPALAEGVVYDKTVRALAESLNIAGQWRAAPVALERLRRFYDQSGQEQRLNFGDWLRENFDEDCFQPEVTDSEQAFEPSWALSSSFAAVEVGEFTDGQRVLYLLLVEQARIWHRRDAYSPRIAVAEAVASAEASRAVGAALLAEFGIQTIGLDTFGMDPRAVQQVDAALRDVYRLHREIDANVIRVDGRPAGVYATTVGTGSITLGARWARNPRYFERANQDDIDTKYHRGPADRAWYLTFVHELTHAFHFQSWNVITFFLLRLDREGVINELRKEFNTQPLAVRVRTFEKWLGEQFTGYSFSPDKELARSEALQKGLTEAYAEAGAAVIPEILEAMRQGLLDENADIVTILENLPEERTTPGERVLYRRLVRQVRATVARRRTQTWKTILAEAAAARGGEPLGPQARFFTGAVPYIEVFTGIGDDGRVLDPRLRAALERQGIPVIEIQVDETGAAFSEESLESFIDRLRNREGTVAQYAAAASAPWRVVLQVLADHVGVTGQLNDLRALFELTQRVDELDRRIADPLLFSSARAESVAQRGAPRDEWCRLAGSLGIRSGHVGSDDSDPLPHRLPQHVVSLVNRVADLDSQIARVSDLIACRRAWPEIFEAVGAEAVTPFVGFSEKKLREDGQSDRIVVTVLMPRADNESDRHYDYNCTLESALCDPEFTAVLERAEEIELRYVAVIDDSEFPYPWPDPDSLISPVDTDGVKWGDVGVKLRLFDVAQPEMRLREDGKFEVRRSNYDERWRKLFSYPEKEFRKAQTDPERNRAELERYGQHRDDMVRRRRAVEDEWKLLARRLGVEPEDLAPDNLGKRGQQALDRFEALEILHAVLERADQWETEWGTWSGRRQLSLERVPNARDIGGLPTGDGGRTRFGVLFRSSTPQYATESDVRKLRNLGVDMVLDLRTPEQSLEGGHGLLPGAGIQCVNLPITTDGKLPRGKQDFTKLYLRSSTSKVSAQSIVRTVRHLIDSERRAVMIHCIHGRDRTGILIALLLAAVGVRTEAIVHDYALTNANLHRLKGLPGNGGRATEPVAIRRLLEFLDKQGGAPAFLRSLGVTNAELGLLRDVLIEPTPTGIAPTPRMDPQPIAVTAGEPPDSVTPDDPNGPRPIDVENPLALQKPRRGRPSAAGTEFRFGNDGRPARDALGQPGDDRNGRSVPDDIRGAPLPQLPGGGVSGRNPIDGAPDLESVGANDADPYAVWLRKLSARGVDTEQMMSGLTTIWDFLRHDPKWAFDTERNYDAVIMLGGPDDGGSAVVANFIRERGLDGIPVVFSGWRGEAARFGLAAEKMGLGSHRIIEEPDAQNTRQNVANSADLLAELGHDVESVVAVCAPHHSRRVVATFAKQAPAVQHVSIVSAQISVENYIRYGLRSDTHEDPTPDHVVVEILREIKGLRESPRLGHIVEQEIPRHVLAVYHPLTGAFLRSLVERLVALDRSGQAVTLMQERLGRRVFRRVCSRVRRLRLAREFTNEAFKVAVDRFAEIGEFGEIGERGIEDWVVVNARNLIAEHESNALDSAESSPREGEPNVGGPVREPLQQPGSADASATGSDGRESNRGWRQWRLTRELELGRRFYNRPESRRAAVAVLDRLLEVTTALHPWATPEQIRLAAYTPENKLWGGAVLRSVSLDELRRTGNLRELMCAILNVMVRNGEPRAAHPGTGTTLVEGIATLLNQPAWQLRAAEIGLNVEALTAVRASVRKNKPGAPITADDLRLVEHLHFAHRAEPRAARAFVEYQRRVEMNEDRLFEQQRRRHFTLEDWHRLGMPLSLRELEAIGELRKLRKTRLRPGRALPFTTLGRVDEAVLEAQLRAEDPTVQYVLPLYVYDERGERVRDEIGNAVVDGVLAFHDAGMVDPATALRLDPADFEVELPWRPGVVLTHFRQGSELFQQLAARGFPLSAGPAGSAARIAGCVDLLGSITAPIRDVHAAIAGFMLPYHHSLYEIVVGMRIVGARMLDDVVSSATDRDPHALFAAASQWLRTSYRPAFPTAEPAVVNPFDRDLWELREVTSTPYFRSASGVVTARGSLVGVEFAHHPDLGPDAHATGPDVPKPAAAPLDIPPQVAGALIVHPVDEAIRAGLVRQRRELVAGLVTGFGADGQAVASATSELTGAGRVRVSLVLHAVEESDVLHESLRKALDVPYVLRFELDGRMVELHVRYRIFDTGRIQVLLLYKNLENGSATAHTVRRLLDSAFQARFSEQVIEVEEEFNGGDSLVRPRARTLTPGAAMDWFAGGDGSWRVELTVGLPLLEHSERMTGAAVAANWLGERLSECGWGDDEGRARAWFAALTLVSDVLRDTTGKVRLSVTLMDKVRPLRGEVFYEGAAINPIDLDVEGSGVEFLPDGAGRSTWFEVGTAVERSLAANPGNTTPESS